MSDSRTCIRIWSVEYGVRIRTRPAIAMELTLNPSRGKGASTIELMGRIRPQTKSLLLRAKFLSIAIKRLIFVTL